MVKALFLTAIETQPIPSAVLVEKIGYSKFVVYVASTGSQLILPYFVYLTRFHSIHFIQAVVYWWQEERHET